MLHLTITRFCHLHSLLRINLEDSVFNRVLYFCKHVVAVTVYDLNELTNLSTGIGKILLLASFTTLLVVINGKCFSENSYKRTIAGKIYRSIIIDNHISVLIRLFYSHIKPDKGLSCTGNSCDETDALLPICFALFYYIEDIGYGSIS